MLPELSLELVVLAEAADQQAGVHQHERGPARAHVSQQLRLAQRLLPDLDAASLGLREATLHALAVLRRRFVNKEPTVERFYEAGMFCEKAFRLR